MAAKDHKQILYIFKYIMAATVEWFSRWMCVLLCAYNAYTSKFHWRHVYKHKMMIMCTVACVNGYRMNYENHTHKHTHNLFYTKRNGRFKTRKSFYFIRIHYKCTHMSSNIEILTVSIKKCDKCLPCAGQKSKMHWIDVW